MDLNMNSDNNENDSANDLNTNESINNHIENLIQNEFNSANYDVNMNYTLNLNQLTQFINLNNQDCLMNSNDNTSILNSTANINDIESFEKEFETNLKAKQSIDSNNTNSNIENDSFSFSFLSDDVLSSGSISSAHLISKPSKLTCSDAENKIFNATSDLKLRVDRFTYKCKYCCINSYSTKFKAHIIEHMQSEHNIYLMQCPDTKCNKQFKDEWKLKRHLLSNRDHEPLSGFKCLIDVMKAHVHVTPQKVGFPCPLCHLDENNNQVVTACLEGINEKKTEYFLYFDSYCELNEHLMNKHTNLDINSYFICKNCGQVFQNRYKLSCHLFNVHSGKRKSRKKQLKLAQQSSQGLVNKVFDSNSYYGPSVDSHIDSVIESVANGMVSLETNNMINFQAIQQQQQMQKIACVGCSKKFKRIRDINSHIRIMHKNWSKVEKEQQDAILEMHIKLIKLNKKNIIKKQISSASLLMSQNENNKNVKICFVCNKIFKELTSTPISSLNKTFIRHMQIQHGLNEKGERLVECPVCEKNFFNRQQMERHMHTHEIWVEIKEKHMNQEQQEQEQQQNNAVIYLSTYDSSFYLDDLTSNQLLANSILKSTDKTNEKLETIDYRDKHSILYCHECVECKLYFKSIKVLTKHKHDAHNLKPVYKCANTVECDQEFETVSSFLEHSKLHPQKNIICTRCQIKFNNKNTLRHHMKNVHYNRRLTTSEVTSAGNVAIKKAIKHNQPQTIRNLNSNKLIISSFVPTSSTNLSVQNTINTSNSIIKPTDLAPSSQESTSTVSNSDDSFCCPTCKKNFTSRNSLHNHLATHNTSELRLFLCNICGHSFKTRKDLSRHASLHDSSKHKTCQECGMSFKTSFHLKRHSLTRHSNLRPFKCNNCDMQFARKDKLKQHEAKHINHPLYQCSQCSKGFYRKEHLKDHEISKHSKQYPFSCEHCNKGFVHAKDLHRHIRVRHLGITPLSANSSSSPSSSSSSSSISTTTMNTHLSSHNNNNSSNNNNGSPSGLIKQKKSKINSLKTANLMPVKQVNNVIALHSSMVAPLTIAAAVPTNPSPSLNANNNDNNNNNKNSNNNTVIASSTPLVQLTSNDFKSKKISSILKSNLISSQFSTPQINTANFENISINNTNLNYTGSNSKQLVPHLITNQPLQKHILQPQNQQQINSAFIASSSLSINNNNNNQFNYDQTKFRFIPVEMNNSGLFVLPSNNDNNINYKAIDVAKVTSPKKSHKKIISQSNISGQQYLKSFKCSTCSKGFFYENHLRKHVLSKHSQTPLYSCSCCNQGFSTRATAKSHVENSHASYACPICNKSFKNKSHCVRHISSTHSSSTSNVLSTLEPKREFKTDAKLIDQSLVNINMLNLIQIDKTSNNKSSVENQSVDLNLKNLTNSIPNSSTHLIIYGKNEVKEKIDHNELATYSNQPLNAFFTNNSQTQDHNKINSISIVATNKNQPFYSNTINMIALKQHSRYNVTTGNSININNATSNSNINPNLIIDNLRFQS